jgi:hypothetical protein
MRHGLRWCLFLLPLVVAAPAEALQEKTVTTGNIVVGKVEAKVLQIHLQLNPKNSSLTTFKIDDGTAITVNGKSAQLADVKPGWKGSVTYFKSSKIIKSLDLNDPDSPPAGNEVQLRGTLDAIQKGFIVVNRQSDGKAFTFKLSPSTKAQIDGVTVMFGDLERGMKVDVYFVENSNFAVRILAYVKDTPPDKK